MASSIVKYRCCKVHDDCSICLFARGFSFSKSVKNIPEFVPETLPEWLNKASKDSSSKSWKFYKERYVHEVVVPRNVGASSREKSLDRINKCNNHHVLYNNGTLLWRTPCLLMFGTHYRSRDLESSIGLFQKSIIFKENKSIKNIQEDTKCFFQIVLLFNNYKV